MKSFASDNYAGVLPQIMEALQVANAGHARSYGADTITERCRQLINTVFEANAAIYFVFNGTGANVLSLAGSAHRYQSVLCAHTAHIYCDESSAPETFTGCRVFALPANAHGKLTPAIVKERLIREGDVHYAQPAVLSVSQSTEYGTVYTPEELAQLSALAHEHGLLMHVDGARFFNAAAALNCSPAALSTHTGIDCLSLGGTKAGMMYGEAVLVFNPGMHAAMPYIQKQAMQLASKNRFIAAQFEALLTGNLWQHTASHANAMAQELGKVLREHSEITLTQPINANAVFALIPPQWVAPLQALYPFYIWNEATGEVRLMCSWDTTMDDINGFANAIATLKG